MRALYEIRDVLHRFLLVDDLCAHALDLIFEYLVEILLVGFFILTNYAVSPNNTKVGSFAFWASNSMLVLAPQAFVKISVVLGVLTFGTFVKV